MKLYPSSRFPHSNLGDCSKVITGSTPPKGNESYWGGEIPFVTPAQLGFQDPITSADEYVTSLGADNGRVIPKGAVLVCCIGSLGKTGVAGVPLICNQQINAVVFDSDRVDLRYGYHAARNLTPLLEHYAPSTTVKIVKKSLFEEFQIPLPPLPEQKRIARILDVADALRARRRTALAELDALLQSTFLDMFGDPVTNPMGWELHDFDDWLHSIDSGWSPKCLDRRAENDEWGVLKLGAVTWCSFNEFEQKALPQHFEPRPEIEVHKGDLLFTRKNTHELVAAAAYVHTVRPKLMLSDLIFRLRLKSTVDVDPLFLWQLLIEPHMRRTIQELATGAAGSMPNISKTKLKAVKLIKPPLELQQRFADIITSVERQKERMSTHLAELDTLFASLQSRAFNGEL